jgi:hypothetical protein
MFSSCRGLSLNKKKSTKIYQMYLASQTFYQYFHSHLYLSIARFMFKSPNTVSTLMSLRSNDGYGKYFQN